MRALLALWMMLLCGSSVALAQSDYLTFTGVWTTVPVTGLTTPSGIAVDKAGNLYIADQALTSIIRVSAVDGTQSTLGTGLLNPWAVTVDAAGNVYIADHGNNRIVKVAAVGGGQSPVGTGVTNPTSVAADATGDVFVTSDEGLVEVVAGVTQSTLVAASGDVFAGVTVDVAGNVYYGDNTSPGLYEIPAGTTSANHLAYVGHTLQLLVDPNDFIFAAEGSPGAQRLDALNGDTTTFDTDAIVAVSLAEDSAYNLYILDSSTQTVHKASLGAVDFGSVNACTSGSTVSPCSSSQLLHFAFDNTISGTVESVAGVGLGTLNYEYSILKDGCSGNLVPGGQCGISLNFFPELAGLRTGAAEIVGSSASSSVVRAPHGSAHSQSRVDQRPLDQPSGTLLASVLLHGIGIAPVGDFTPAPIVTPPFTLQSGGYPYGLASGEPGDCLCP